MLILDDLASTNISPFEIRVALDIDRRINDGRPTVITSNLSLKEIGERMDERIASRLSTFTAIAFRGEYRRKVK